MEKETFDTAHHRCDLDEMGVKLYTTESLEEGETPDVKLSLSYTEALGIARYILAHEAELEARQAELESQFSQLSEAIIALFSEVHTSERVGWKQSVGFVPVSEFDQLLSAAYMRLKEHKAKQVQHWCHEDEEQEVLFWRAFGQFFEDHYRDNLQEQFFPESEQEV